MFSNGSLIVTGMSGARGGGTFKRVLIKDPRGPDPIPAKVSVLPKSRPTVPANVQRRNADGADGLAYIQPGPWKSTLTEKDVVGVWLGFGVGAPKQFFIIKKVGDRLAAWFAARVTTRTRWRRSMTSASKAIR